MTASFDPFSDVEIVEAEPLNGDGDDAAPAPPPKRTKPPGSGRKRGTPNRRVRISDVEFAQSLLPLVKRRLKTILRSPHSSMRDIEWAAKLVAGYGLGSVVTRSAAKVETDSKSDVTVHRDPIVPLELANALAFVRSAAFGASLAEHAPQLIAAQPVSRVADADDVAFEPALQQAVAGGFVGERQSRGREHASENRENTFGIVPENFSDSRPDFADEINMCAFDARTVPELRGATLAETYAFGRLLTYRQPDGQHILYDAAAHAVLHRAPGIAAIREHARNFIEGR